MKVACILARHLAIQVEWQDDASLVERPLIVGGRPWDSGAVLDCCPKASAAGVEAGMRLAQAEALCPAAQFFPGREQAYQSAHDALVTVASRFAPIVETGSLGLIYAEVSGLERVFGPDAKLAQRLTGEAEGATGLTVGVGLAANKFTARQAAAYVAQPRKGYVVPPGEERAFLSRFPLSVLPADLEMRRRLDKLGVTTLGEFVELSRPAVVSQFGPHAGCLHDLARGADSQPVHQDAPPLSIERRRIFDDPLVDWPPLMVHVRQMAAELGEELTRRGYQAEGLRLELESEGEEIGAPGAPVKPPSANPDKLARLAGRLLEKVALAEPAVTPLGTGDPPSPSDWRNSRPWDRGVVAVALTTYPVRPSHLGATQLTLFGSEQDGRREKLRETLRGLRTRFGELAVVAASLVSPPPPCPVQVTTDLEGVPQALVWRDRLRDVAAVYESWQDRRSWWCRPVERDYYRLETGEGQVRVIFRDREADRWLLERRRI